MFNWPCPNNDVVEIMRYPETFEPTGSFGTTANVRQTMIQFKTRVDVLDNSSVVVVLPRLPRSAHIARPASLTMASHVRWPANYGGRGLRRCDDDTSISAADRHSAATRKNPSTVCEAIIINLMEQPAPYRRFRRRMRPPVLPHVRTHQPVT